MTHGGLMARRCRLLLDQTTSNRCAGRPYTARTLDVVEHLLQDVYILPKKTESLFDGKTSIPPPPTT